ATLEPSNKDTLPLGSRSQLLRGSPAMTLALDRADTLDAVLAGRRSIRTYDERPVPADLLERVLTAATHAPSPHHSIPWRLAVLTGPEAKSTLADAMGTRWRADLLADGL